jgi:hypothetical protein
MGLRNIVDKVLPQTNQQIYMYVYTFFTLCMLTLYAFTYLGILRNHGRKYLPLVITARNLILSSFLLIFYNPFRQVYNYGPALHIFAAAAGVSLLLTISRFDILNLVHFCLYGKVLEQPETSCVKVDDSAKAKKALQVSKTIQ